MNHYTFVESSRTSKLLFAKNEKKQSSYPERQTGTPEHRTKKSRTPYQENRIKQTPYDGVKKEHPSPQTTTDLDHILTLGILSPKE